MTIQDQINNVYEQMIYLCEYRGELDPESNAKIEAKLSELQDELQVLEYERCQEVIDFSCDLQYFYNTLVDFSADSCIIVPMMINKEIVLKFSIVDLCSDLMWVGLLFGICYLFVWSV